MPFDFIFMLTHNDRTVEDAAVHLETAIACGVQHIGFKDVGLDLEALKALATRIREAGATSYLEVVSLDRESELSSARAALEIGVDHLLGGTRAEDVLPILAGSDILYSPFPGRITGHPSRLEGTVEEIVDSALHLTALPGVHGLDLLAYRAIDTDPETLTAAVCEAVDKPVFLAGSIDSPARIGAVCAAGAAGFTVGTAALSGRFPAGGSALETQLQAILLATASSTGRLSGSGKVSLASAFAGFQDCWSPKVAGRINNMEVKVVKLSGDFVWHHHDVEDELFLVHRGEMLMKFRDREEHLRAGEFIIVPHGVEHCPVALTDPCEVVLLEPATTLNTGNIENERTVRDLGRVG